MLMSYLLQVLSVCSRHELTLSLRKSEPVTGTLFSLPQVLSKKKKKKDPRPSSPANYRPKKWSHSSYDQSTPVVDSSIFCKYFPSGEIQALLRKHLQNLDAFCKYSIPRLLGSVSLNFGFWRNGTLKSQNLMRNEYIRMNGFGYFKI